MHAACQSRLGFCPGHFSRKLGTRGQITVDSSEREVNFLMSSFYSGDGLCCHRSYRISTVLDFPTSERKNPISLARFASHELRSDHNYCWPCRFGRVANRLKEGSSSSPLLQPTSFSGKIWIKSKTLGKWLVAPHGASQSYVLYMVQELDGLWFSLLSIIQLISETFISENYCGWVLLLKQNYILNLNIIAPSFSAFCSPA